MSFVHSTDSAAAPAPDDLYLVIKQDLLLAAIANNGGVRLPTSADLANWANPSPEPLKIGAEGPTSYWLLALPEDVAPPPSGWTWHDTRTLLAQFTPDQHQAMCCARQLHWWNLRHRFCGVCGTATVAALGERAKECPKCHASFFPVASPAVIVAVTRGDEILLAHNRNFRPGLFSLLAGFVEPGETLEQPAIREVSEEVRIHIHQLRYVASKPWPFPNSIMIAFRADYLSGEIQVDQTEIEKACWYRPDNLPDLPSHGTIARHLIESWLREGR